MHPELSALWLADGRLPIGGHAHSSGLEPALRAGLPPERIPEFLRTRLRSVALVDAAAAVLARRAGADGNELAAVCDAVHARTPSSAMRVASGLLGSGLARLAGRLWPEHPAVRALGALDSRPPRAVALGVAGSVTGVEDAALARGCLYDDAHTVATAALKLLPVDPVDASGWVLDASQAIEEAVTRAVMVTCADDLPAPTAPLLEQWSLEHENARRRLFVA